MVRLDWNCCRPVSTLEWLTLPENARETAESPRLVGTPVHISKSLPPLYSWTARVQETRELLTTFVAQALKDIEADEIFRKAYVELMLYGDTPERRAELMKWMEGEVARRVKARVDQLRYGVS